MNQPQIISIEGSSYDSATVDLLRQVLDAAWAELSEVQRNELPRSLLAQRLLLAASEGEREPTVLRSRALGLQTKLAPDSP